MSELEGLTIYGGKLVRLLRGLGRIFNIMAKDAVGHAPEVTQFYFAEQVTGEAEQILRSAVMHLAIVRYTGSKPSVDTDTKDYDYALHPLFSPFFMYSYRRKRKMRMRPNEIVGLASTDSRETIDTILTRNHRSLDEVTDVFEPLGGLFLE